MSCEPWPHEDIPPLTLVHSQHSCANGEKPTEIYIGIYSYNTVRHLHAVAEDFDAAWSIDVEAVEHHSDGWGWMSTDQPYWHPVSACTGRSK